MRIKYRSHPSCYRQLNVRVVLKVNRADRYVNLIASCVGKIQFIRFSSVPNKFTNFYFFFFSFSYGTYDNRFYQRILMDRRSKCSKHKTSDVCRDRSITKINDRPAFNSRSSRLEVLTRIDQLISIDEYCVGIDENYLHKRHVD